MDKDSLTDAQKECYQMLCDLVGGEHHITGKVHESSPSGIWTSMYSGYFSTFDFYRLTTLVLMSHDRCIRAEIASSAPGYVKLYLHKRKRSGDMMNRHPDINEAIETFNKSSYKMNRKEGAK